MKGIPHHADEVRSARGGALMAVLLLSFMLAMASSAAPASAQNAPLQGVDRYIEQAMRDWKIPGLALAVVHGDSVVHSRGFGLREIGRAEPVDVNTVFAIGSASKGFTAAALAMLVDDDRMDWNDLATRHLPGFQLFDPYATRGLTVRDLLSHRSGLSRGDQVWYGTEFGRDEILRRTRYLEPSWGFREQFGYQNLMYLAAGQVVPALTDTSWDDFVIERIFRPLGMTNSVTSTIPLAGMTNVASPHAEIDGTVKPVAWRNLDNVGPAGSINSSVRDMAQWLRLQLGGGEYLGQRLLSEDAIAAMHSPETIIPLEGGWATMALESHFLTYGLGWFLHDYRGRKVVQHGGNIDGMHALVAMMPEEDLGLVVLTNRNPNSLTMAAMYRIFDAFLDEPERDWSARLLARTDSLAQAGQAREREIQEARVAETRPSLELERYAGTYRHPMYGDIVVALSNDQLHIGLGSEAGGVLEHWHYDTFRARWHDEMRGSSYANFLIDAGAEAAHLELEGLARFDRVPDPGADR